MNDYSQPVRESQILNQMGCQEKAISELMEVVEQLASRLDRVVLQTNPVIRDTDLRKASVESLSPLANELRANNVRLDQLSLRLRDVLSRLEL